MKKYLAGLILILALPSFSWSGAYTLLRDASTLNRGTLPNERLDPSSVTLVGPNVSAITSTQTFSGLNTFSRLVTFSSSILVAGDLVRITQSSVTATIIGTPSSPAAILNTTQTFSGKNTIIGQSSVTAQIYISSSMVFQETASLGAEGGKSVKLKIVARDSLATETALAIRQFNAGFFGFGFDFGISDTNGDMYIDGVQAGISSGPIVTFSNRNVSRYMGVGLFDKTVVPAAGVHVKKGNDTLPVLRLDIDVAQAFLVSTHTFIDFRSQTGSEGSIAGTGAAGVIAYNTFTGSHFTQIDDKSQMNILYLVEGTGEKLTPFSDKSVQREVTDEEKKNGYKGKGTKQGENIVEMMKSEASPKPQLTKSRLCTTRKSPAAWGFWLGTDSESRDMIASIGTGFAFVANKGANIAIGDYLMSSDVAGHVEKQDDDLQHNYSVAKARVAIIWNPGETFRKIAVTYHGG